MVFELPAQRAAFFPVTRDQRVFRARHSAEIWAVLVKVRPKSKPP